MSENELTQYIQCDIELEVAAPSEKVAAGWVAALLRETADKLEQGEFESGHHDLKTKFGRKVGEVYLDFSEGFHVDDGVD